MSSPKSAVILNAGIGSRLKPLTNDTPKCLLSLNDQTILEHQINGLLKYGIKDITMVLGYLSDKIINFSKEKFPDLTFNFLINSNYLCTNTLHSLWIAIQSINGPFIYLNGDVFYDDKIINCLLTSPRKTCLAISKHELTQEEVKVILREDLVIAIGKHLQPVESYGEFIGVAKFSEESAKSLKKQLNNDVKNGKSNNYFEFSLDSILKNKNIYGIDISELPCIEIDTLNDFKRAIDLSKTLI